MKSKYKSIDMLQKLLGGPIGPVIRKTLLDVCKQIRQDCEEAEVDAHEEGYSQGYDDGDSRGHNEGYDEGYAEGYAAAVGDHE